VPLRFPRPVMALIATGTAAICLGVSAMPASADQVRNQEWWLNSLHVTGAWAASQGSGVTVAVLSDGVDASAADLSGSVTKGAVPSGFLTASGQYAGEQGTPIASLIAGHGHGPGSGDGIVGVAPKARILSIAVSLPPDDPELAQSSDAAAIPGAIAEGIRYAVTHGATVIDLPIDPGQAGSTATVGASAAAGGSAAERAAVGYALAHNVVLVAPAGDDETAGDAPNYPAAYDGVIAVGAFDSAFSLAAWSSHQHYVTLTAPGAGVVVADNAGGYQAINSTSAASAVVSGVVALIRSRYPSLTAAEIRQTLITTTTHRRAGGLAIGSGYGAVDAGQAMAAAATLATPPGQRAAGGALPRVTPAAVPAPSSSRGIGAQIVRAAEISGALLIVLLLMTIAYVATGRRRRRPQPAVAAEWTHRQAQSRYPHAGSDADRMLELFSSPAPAPTVALGAPAAPAGRHAPPPAGDGGWPGGGDGVFAPTVGRGPGGSASGEPTGEPAVAGASDSGWVSHGPASRAVNRRPSVSGAPPWEPAAAPDGELPWAAAPGRHAGAPAVDRSARRALAPDQRAWGAPGHVAPADAPAFAAARELDYAAESGYNQVSRADRFDRELTALGFGSPAGAGPSGVSPSDPYSTWPGSGIGAAPPADYPSPTGSSAPADFDAPPDYSSPIGSDSASVRYGSNPGYSSSGDWSTPGDYGYRGGSPGPAERGSELDASPAPSLAQSGLPVRQPRASQPSGLAPLSPSGSLWEPASRDASRANEATDYPDQSYDTSGRPIFVWDPARSREPREASSGD
jgi:hypothetical protein